MMTRKLATAITIACGALANSALHTTVLAQDPQDSHLEQALQTRLNELRTRSRAPGITVGVALADGSTLSLAAGESDTLSHLSMTTADRMMQGSVGKTYVAAVAMQLAHEGLLDLSAPVSTYLGNETWFSRMPNLDRATVRQLMNHTSGIIRYEFDDQFITDLVADPDRVWLPEELLAYLFDTEAPFAPGDGWDYSDTNYIILGMIIERLTGHSYYDEMRSRLLLPLALDNTVPSDSRSIPGLVQGYAGVENMFRLPEAVIADGEFAINPQFEWTGGGIASTSEDLARWGKALYEGQAFDPSMLPVMLEAVPARLGPNVSYGLGVIVRPTPLGVAWGHSGFFPGYLTEMAYFPDHGFAIAVQFNTSDFESLGMSPGAVLMQLARVVSGAE